MDFEEELQDELDHSVHGSSCGCCTNTNTNTRGACICTDCKCHLRTRKQTIWTDPVVLYGALSVAMMAIFFLAIK